MKKCPYIKWYETINKVYIDILNYSNNSVINIENNNLDYSDNLYEIKTELFSDCELDKYFYKNNTTTIILNKMNENKWSYIFKNKNKYNYFISTNWDKMIDNDMFLRQNIDYDSEEFDKLLKSGELDNISDSSDSSDELENNIEIENEVKNKTKLQNDKIKII